MVPACARPPWITATSSCTWRTVLEEPEQPLLRSAHRQQDKPQLYMMEGACLGKLQREGWWLGVPFAMPWGYCNES